MPRRVLVTGADGLIGQAVMSDLADRYDLRAVTHAPADFPSTVADVADLEAVTSAMSGVDAVVHLAAAAEVDSEWESVLPANVIGVRNVFEAAHRSGVELVVFASSNHVVGMYEVEGGTAKVGADAPVRPDSLYGASKAWGEALGRWYAERLDLRVICLRIGMVVEDDRVPAPAAGASAEEIQKVARLRGMWLSRADCVGLIAAALDAPASVRFAIVNGVGDNRGRWLSLEEGRRILGWWPRDSEAGR